MNKKSVAVLVLILICNIFLFSISVDYPLVSLDQPLAEIDVPQDEKEDIPPAVGMVKEIETHNGVQKYLYVGLGKRTRGLKPGLYGYVYNDVQMKEKVGKAQVVEIYDDVIKMKIIEINYLVKRDGLVSIEVDPDKYIKK